MAQLVQDMIVPDAPCEAGAIEKLEDPDRELAAGADPVARAGRAGEGMLSREVSHDP